MTEQKLENEEEFITVQVKIYKPFYEFIRAYLDFFADPSWTIEDFVRQAVYDSVVNLVEQLRIFREDGNVTHIPDEKWMAKWKKHPVLFRYPDEEGKSHA